MNPRGTESFVGSHCTVTLLMLGHGVQFAICKVNRVVSSAQGWQETEGGSLH